MRLPDHDAVILAGGSARRLGGLDKPGQYVGPLTLLDRVIHAVSRAGTVVVVGPPRPTRRPVTWAREDPVGAGPVAALKAGLAQVTATAVVVLAADLPFVTEATVEGLLAAAGATGALLVDAEDRDQYLCSAWPTTLLRSADLDGSRLGGVLGAPTAKRVRSAARPGVPAPWMDCDTPYDLELARRVVGK